MLTVLWQMLVALVIGGGLIAVIAGFIYVLVQIFPSMGNSPHLSPEEEQRWHTKRQTDALEQMARVQYDTLVNNHTFKNPNKRN